MYQVMWTTEIWLGIRWNYHTQAQLKWRSLCAPLDIVPLLPLTFFSIFGLSLFFLDSLTFYFYFFDIFSSLRITKEVTIENMSLNKWKVWPVENSEDMLKNWQKASDHEKRIFWAVFGQNKIFEPGCFTFAPLFFV